MFISNAFYELTQKISVADVDSVTNNINAHEIYCACNKRFAVFVE